MKRGEVRVDPEVIDRERFERHYRIYVEQVIKQICGDDSGSCSKLESRTLGAITETA